MMQAILYLAAIGCAAMGITAAIITWPDAYISATNKDVAGALTLLAFEYLTLGVFGAAVLSALLWIGGYLAKIAEYQSAVERRAAEEASKADTSWRLER